MKTIIIIISLFLSISAFAGMQELGKTVYTKACQTCHSPLVAKSLKAPAAFDEKVWHQRFEQAKQEAKANPQKYKTAWDYMLYQVKIGKGLMHHGGLCKETGLSANYCNDAAYIAAIKYMSNPKNKE